jgi:hypothetical protein
MGNAHIDDDSSSVADLLFIRGRVIAARDLQSAVR